ncbi:membrane protein [Spirochaetia bacterium]|nr:membrane protein [Spirochaetia bacterium]
MNDKFKTFHSGRANFLLLAFIALILGGTVLKISAPVIIPFTIALLLAFVMEPMVRFLQKRRVPRMVSILLAVIIIASGLYLMGVVLYSSGRTILSSYPKYENRLTEIYVGVADLLDLSYDEHLTFIENLLAQLGVRSRIRNITFSLSNSFIGFLKDALMVVLFVIFLLAEAAFFERKVELAFEGKRSGQIKKISNDIVLRITRYLSIKFIISLITGIVIAIGLSLAGLEFALVWGFIQFILNFIPNLGSIAVGIGATLFAVLQFWPDPGPIIVVALIMLGVNMIIGSVLDPKIMGDSLGLSPLAVIMSLMIWGGLWGFAGMVLAVPMTVIVKIICETFPFLEPFSILLGSRRSLAAKAPEPPTETAEGI